MQNKTIVLRIMSLPVSTVVCIASQAVSLYVQAVVPQQQQHGRPIIVEKAGCRGLAGGNTYTGGLRGY